MHWGYARWVIWKGRRVCFAFQLVIPWVLFTFIQFQIRVVRPPNYAFAIFIGILLASIGCILYVRRKSLEFIYNKNYWAIAAVVNMPYIIFYFMHGTYGVKPRKLFYSTFQGSCRSLDSLKSAAS